MATPGRRKILAAAVAFAGLAGTPALGARRHRIGFFSATTGGSPIYQGTLLGRLRDLGYRHEEHFVYRSFNAGVDLARLPLSARELIAWRPDLIVSNGALATAAAAAATREIPIFGHVLDTRAEGYSVDGTVPARNVTGVTVDFVALWLKMIELAGRLLPGLRAVALIWPAGNPLLDAVLPTLAKASAKIGIGVLAKQCATGAELRSEIASLARRGAQAFSLVYSATLLPPEQVAEIALRQRVAWVDSEIDGPLVRSGAVLLGYGPVYGAPAVDLANQIQRYFVGTPLEYIPFQMPVGYRLEVNRTTASRLGLKIPPDIEIRAHAIHD
ncbi:MAG TPA: ABC transporter substrate binding protein [Usitatibacter sp.]|nr:ABC transporter substrate binding protein [Usitatibacter sp.]